MLTKEKIEATFEVHMWGIYQFVIPDERKGLHLPKRPKHFIEAEDITSVMTREEFFEISDKYMKSLHKTNPESPFILTLHGAHKYMMEKYDQLTSSSTHKLAPTY